MKFIDLEEQQKILKKDLDKNIQTVLDHGQYIMGPEVFELEKKLGQYVGVKNCISCASGTDALLMVLMSLGIGKGDAVLTSPFTYIATAEVIQLLNATPVFIDINETTYNLEPEGIEDAFKYAIQLGLKPKAIIPVDLFGLPARYRIIKKLAAHFKLLVIEDGAQSFGSEIKGKKSCSFGDISTTSFFPAKPLGCYGDGGAIFTNDDALAAILRSIRNHGSGLDKYDNVRVGINGRLDTIQASILLSKLSIFDDELRKRNIIASKYKNQLKSAIITPYIPKNYTSSWAQYSILLPDTINRDELIISLKKENIPSAVYYRTPLHLQKVFNNLGLKRGSFPITEKISDKILSIPMSPYLTDNDQDKVLTTINKLF